MARLHIGYSFIARSFLLKGEERPACIRCDQLLTVKLTRSDLVETRGSHYTAQSLRALFEEVSVKKIFNFLKAVNIFGRI